MGQSLTIRTPEAEAASAGTPGDSDWQTLAHVCHTGVGRPAEVPQLRGAASGQAGAEETWLCSAWSLSFQGPSCQTLLSQFSPIPGNGVGRAPTPPSPEVRSFPGPAGSEWPCRAQAGQRAAQERLMTLMRAGGSGELPRCEHTAPAPWRSPLPGSPPPPPAFQVRQFLPPERPLGQSELDLATSWVPSPSALPAGCLLPGSPAWGSHVP